MHKTTTHAILLLVSFFSVGVVGTTAQDKYLVPACGDERRGGRFVGDRLKMFVPRDVEVKLARDLDYAQYSLGFGAPKRSAWLTGIYGPSASSGQPPKLMTEQNVLSRRTWSFQDVEGADTRGRTGSGKFWRYVGTYGESINYYDVSQEAAEYFDKFLDGVCYDPNGGRGLTAGQENK